jgi:hypothetical protein
MLTTDDEILDWVKNAAETTYHPVGTGPFGLGSVSIGIQPSIRSGASRPAREHTNARIGVLP